MTVVTFLCTAVDDVPHAYGLQRTTLTNDGWISVVATFPRGSPYPEFRVGHEYEFTIQETDRKPVGAP